VVGDAADGPSTATFYEIMDILDKRLNDKGKNWRHVLKSLKVLDYCLHEGSELVVTWARENIYIIKTLREFQHIDDEGRDVGQNSECSHVSRPRPSDDPSPSVGQGIDVPDPRRGTTAGRAAGPQVLEVQGVGPKRI
jgi:hypothetical protein